VAKGHSREGTAQPAPLGRGKVFGRPAVKIFKNDHDLYHLNKQTKLSNKCITKKSEKSRHKSCLLKNLLFSIATKEGDFELRPK
jgi:hypothetical protein